MNDHPTVIVDEVEGEEDGAQDAQDAPVRPDITNQRTMLFWRRPVTRLVLPEAELVEVAPRVLRIRYRTVAILAVIALLLAVLGYSVGYASGHRSTRTPALPSGVETPAHSAWQTVWRQSGNGPATLSPPLVSPRFLLAWSCNASANQSAGTTLMVTLGQGGQYLPIANVACPGYGNAVISLPQASAYTVTMNATDDVRWMLYVERAAT